MVITYHFKMSSPCNTEIIVPVDFQIQLKVYFITAIALYKLFVNQLFTIIKIVPPQMLLVRFLAS